MTLVEYIAALQAQLEEHGNLEVERETFDGSRVPVTTGGTISYRKVLKGREHKPRFWSQYIHDEDEKGDKILRVG